MTTLQPIGMPSAEPMPTTRPWWHAWSHGLMISAGLLFIAYLFWLGHIWGSAIDTVWMSDSCTIVFSSVALTCAIRAARHSALDARTRRAWTILAIAFACDLLANLLWWYYEVGLGESPFPSLADIFYLAYYPIVLWGLLRMPTARRDRTERATIWLDVGIVTAATTLALWYYLLYPTAAESHPGTLELVLSLAYPIGDIILLFGLTMTLMSRPQPRTRPALLLLSLGLLAIFAADVVFSYLTLHGGYQSGGWLDAVWILGYLLVANAAQAQCYHRTRRADDVESELPPRQLSVLPYLAIAAGYGLLLNTAIHEWAEPARGLLIGTAGLTLLVVVRQVIASRENIRLASAQEQLRAAAALAIQQREARVRSLLQSASDGLLILDRALTIYEQTPPIERLLGYAEGLLAQRLVLDLVHLDDAAHVQSLLAQTLADARPLTAACRMRHQDAGWIDVEIVVTNLLADPAVGGIVVNIRDLRERRAREAAEAATRAKSAFLAYMSHELRTPLTAILGYREIIDLKTQQDGYDAIATDLARIEQSGQHLLALIGEVLDLAKIEAGRMELEVWPVAVRPIVDMVRESVAPLVARGGNQLVVVDDPRVGYVLADVMRLRQVLFNLLSNASKFTKNGTITVATARLAAGDDETVQIRVSDTGIGMSAEELDHVFEPYAQANVTTTRQYGGTGLGLTLSRHYCRLMGGDLTVTSVLGQGTTFVVQLPAVQGHPDQAPAEASPASTGSAQAKSSAARIGSCSAAHQEATDCS